MEMNDKRQDKHLTKNLLNMLAEHTLEFVFCFQR